jgi:hypothetical protein
VSETAPPVAGYQAVERTRPSTHPGANVPEVSRDLRCQRAGLPLAHSEPLREPHMYPRTPEEEVLT